MLGVSQAERHWCMCGFNCTWISMLTHTCSRTRAGCHCPCLGTGALGPLWGGAIPTILTISTSQPWLGSPDLYPVDTMLVSKGQPAHNSNTESFPQFFSPNYFEVFCLFKFKNFWDKRLTTGWYSSTYCKYWKPWKAKNYFEIMRFPAIVLKRIKISSGCILYNMSPASFEYLGKGTAHRAGSI